MATCRVIVNSALRKLGRLGAGREARTADAADTLAALENLYRAWISSGAFGRLCDVVPTGTDYIARGPERILRQTDTLNVTLPDLVSDGWLRAYGSEYQGGNYGTLVTITVLDNEVIVDVQPAQPIDGNAITPRDGTPVVISDMDGGETASWLYDGTIKQWQRVDALTLDSEAPRSHADAQGLAALLALEMADEFGIPVGPGTARQAQRYIAAMTQRFGMRRENFYNPGAYF